MALDGKRSERAAQGKGGASEQTADVFRTQICLMTQSIGPSRCRAGLENPDPPGSSILMMARLFGLVAPRSEIDKEPSFAWK